ncbi:hypothetical protein LCGC14_1391450 [marine sediment metagenome]|uniref:Uncharacterized protein n=1 Tax=marine sediment metagenome TaxID=412755 RepID=A0A0F9N1F9_9ZZZZ|nr:MAG: hypothetical protein Lokiarch_40670 [Candidatus Lokiarchaeum sp. GC14_75]
MRKAIESDKKIVELLDLKVGDFLRLIVENCS